MKIIQQHSGQPFQLFPDTTLEIERTNPFFNEYGETSLPATLPDTPYNRSLLGQSQSMAVKKKIDQKQDVIISEGVQSYPARMTVLSGKERESFSVSFAMSDGAMNSRLSATQLSDIFGDETIPGVTSVTEGVNFCRSLIDGSNPHYAIFPVLMDGDTDDTGKKTFRCLNNYGYQDTSGKWITAPGATSDFYNAVVRSELVDDVLMSIPIGFDMTPFMKANYLLERIFAYLGYTINDNFFTQTPIFTQLVFLNNVRDTLINGSIRLRQLLPPVMASTIINLYRKKFCCEFIPDEVTKTISIKLFNEAITEPVSIDLSSFLDARPEVTFPDKYKQLIIASENSVAPLTEKETFNSAAELFSKYPAATYDPLTGSFVRKGFQELTELTEIVATSSMRYYEGGNLATEEITVPDSLPLLELNPYLNNSYEGAPAHFLYIGSSQLLNSKMLTSATSQTEVTDTDTSSGESLKPILAFYDNAYQLNGYTYPHGTISNKVIHYPANYIPYVGFGSWQTRLSDYALTYYGDDGIFERFYRKYDTMLRNSMHTVKASLLPPPAIKNTLPPCQKVLLNGQELFINTFKYSLGVGYDPLQSEFFTIRSYEPVLQAKTIDQLSSSSNYKWVVKVSVRDVTREEYDLLPKTLQAIFPPVPESRHVGAQWFLQKFGFGLFTYSEETVWLEVEPV